jgi:hypothetical protein
VSLALIPTRIVVVLVRTAKAASCSSSGFESATQTLARVLRGALGRAALHGRAFPGVAGQRCRMEEVLPGTIMLPDTAAQVAGDRWQ